MPHYAASSNLKKSKKTEFFRKLLINIDNVLQENDAPPRAVDVFMFDQGAYAGLFNNGGNYLATLNVDAQIPRPDLREAVRKFQGELLSLDAVIEERNKARQTPFLRLQPRHWKASISY